MGKNSFVFYRDWGEGLRSLPIEIKAELYDAIVDLALDGIERELSPMSASIMKFIKPRILIDRKRYEEMCERNKNNGSQGGRPKTQSVQIGSSRTEKTQSVQVGSSRTEKTEMGADMIHDMIHDDDTTTEEPKGSLSAKADDEQKTEDINYQGLVNYYNSFCQSSNLIRCVKLTEKRKRAIRARIKEYGKENVAKAIQKAASSTFLNGHNDRNWRADIDFVFNANKMARILEGKYDNQNMGINGNGFTENNSSVQREAEQRQREYARVAADFFNESQQELASRDAETSK